MNSGLLADPSPSSRFNYETPPSRSGSSGRSGSRPSATGMTFRSVPPAIQFPLAHPAVASIAAGVRTADHLDEYPAFMRLPIPAELWSDLRAEGLIRDDAPTPA